MTAPSIEFVTVGSGGTARAVAYRQRAGTAPGVFFLPGYRSDMAGSKAQRMDTWGAARGMEVTRFDYSGHGNSGGAFLDGTISRWLEEALAVFALTHGPQIVIGSSMGGWLALLLNRALRSGGLSRVKALVLIAPAVDMTEELMRPGLMAAELQTLETTGLIEQGSDYADTPYPVTRALLEDGRQHLLFGAPIETGCPVIVLQGGQDPDVPPAQAFKLVHHLVLDPVTLTMIPDGDHRLSREEDLLRLERAVELAIEG